MHFPHMSVNSFSTRESLHTLPTDMRLASRTRQMIAPLYLLDPRVACRALLDIVLLDPFLEQFVLHLVRTLELVVRLRVTPRTDARETRRAL